MYGSIAKSSISTLNICQILMRCGFSCQIINLFWNTVEKIPQPEWHKYTIMKNLNELGMCSYNCKRISIFVFNLQGEAWPTCLDVLMSSDLICAKPACFYRLFPTFKKISKLLYLYLKSLDIETGHPNLRLR